jgi:two-component system OmpR family response regulator
MTAATLPHQPDEATVLALIDDDEGLRGEIAEYLRSHGYVVVDAPDVAGLEALLTRPPVHLIILDVMLPGEDGLSACKRMSRGKGPPILMLSAMADDVDRILGLELGAGDYLVKPVNPRELLARVRAMLRRGLASQVVAQQAFLFGGFRLDLAYRRLTAPDQSIIMLTPGEFSLLTVLLQHPCRVLSREQILEHARGEGAEVFDRAIDVQISRLRRKLHFAAHDDIIRTYRGLGYMLDVKVMRI